MSNLLCVCLDYPNIVLIGYPPKEIKGNPKDTLEKIGIKNGEQIQIKQGNGVHQGKSIGPYIPPIDPKGCLEIRKMPGDNSCLYHSCAYILHDKCAEDSKAYELRQLCAQIIASDPKTYNEGFLGMKNTYYIDTLLHPDTWGGGIELYVLANYYQIEICSIDVQTGREDMFGHEKGFSRKGFVFYNGKHYDAMALSKHGGAHQREDQVLFNSQDADILKKVRNFIKVEYADYVKKNGKLIN
jgi:ubiquitin thioesterase OTU1